MAGAAVLRPPLWFGQIASGLAFFMVEHEVLAVRES